MALTHEKVVTLSANSKIGEEVAVRLSATVSSKTNVSSVYGEEKMDTKTYNDNKAQVRKDMDDFRTLVYQLEDELAAEAALEEE